MRYVNYHKVNELEKSLVVIALDEPGSGGAHHEYEVHLANKIVTKVSFQNGPISSPEQMNGVTNEALLAIVIDRLECFSKGPYPSRETSLALTKLQEALHWLNHRTLERTSRGVEGKLEK